MKNVWLNPRYAKVKPAKAIFSDRDGTLIRHVDYVSNPDLVELLPGVKESLHRLIQAKIPVFIFSNQSGVGRGYFPLETVHACQKRLFDLLEIQPDELAGWCIAPEAPDSEGGYRKPSPRFIEEACQHMGNKTEQCHMIGDTLVDLETAWGVGARAWAVACGKPELPERIRAGAISGPHELCDTFGDCVRSILASES